MAIANCVFSSGRHVCEILSVGVPLLRVLHVKPAVILLLQSESSPIQQSNGKTYLGLQYVACFSSNSAVVSKSRSNSVGNGLEAL